MFSLINLRNNCVLVRISWYNLLHPCFVVEQMLRSSGSTSKPRGWGRPLESKVRPLSPARHMETVDSDGEATPAPGYRQSFGDAIAAALQATSIHSGKPLLLIGFRVLRGYETLKLLLFCGGMQNRLLGPTHYSQICASLRLAACRRGCNYWCTTNRSTFKEQHSRRFPSCCNQ